MAYQSFGRGIDLKLIQLVTQAVVQDAIPSTTFLLDCDLDICLSRLNNKDRMENLGKDFLLKVKQGFLELALLNKNRYVIVDANQSIAKIQDSIWTVFKDKYIK